MDWTHLGVLFILALHSIAAVVTLISAIRDRLGFVESLQWGGIGFITGMVGLLTRARMDRRHVNYARIVQDTLINLGLEVVIIFGMPFFFR
jgi:nitrate reductase gamma subunit